MVVFRTSSVVAGDGGEVCFGAPERNINFFLVGVAAPIAPLRLYVGLLAEGCNAMRLGAKPHAAFEGLKWHYLGGKENLHAFSLACHALAEARPGGLRRYKHNRQAEAVPRLASRLAMSTLTW